MLLFQEIGAQRGFLDAEREKLQTILTNMRDLKT